MEVAFQSGFASALLDVLFNRVTNAFLNELEKFKNVNEAVVELETTVMEAHKQLQNVDTFCYQGNSEHVIRNRVDSLTALCYDAEDVMDEIALAISKDNSGNALLRYLKTVKIPHYISKLQEKFNSILDQLKALEEGKCNGYNEQVSATFSNENASDMEVSLVGRETDVIKVVQELIRHSSKGVSIIGLDGIGKTTLAQKIQWHTEIAQKFPVRIWVTASNGCFNIEETNKRLDEVMGNEQHKRNVLIILDNLLEVSHTEWDLFLCSDRKNISKIKFLITTHNPIISQQTSTGAYYLKYLSDECCKTLIMQKARQRNSNLSGSWFSHVAGTLASKCAGLPLVARIIGLVLATCDEDNWVCLMEEDLWQLPVVKEQLLRTFSYSLQNLQSHVRKCLAYFSLFPQNHCFNMEELVQLWVGERFIEGTNESSNLERIGQECIDELLKRSILQISNETNHVGRPMYHLHIFTQKFARLAASHTCIQLKNESMLSSMITDARHIRHMSLLCEKIQPSNLDTLKKFKLLRTILSLFDIKIGQLGKFPHDFFKPFARLRVLGLSGTNIIELPSFICRLKRLRYLDVSKTPLNTLPHKLCEVITLKFLKLNNTTLLCLPKEFHRLTNLLHVDWDANSLERLCVPPYIGNIHGLQTLPLFHVGDKDGYSITELQYMNCLKGSIHIKNLENVKRADEARTAMLDQKPFLRRIELQWDETSTNNVAKEVLMNLRPHCNLEELKITKYGGDKFSDWLVSPFPRLRKIHLHKCHSCSSLPALGQLEALETLVLQEMSNVISIDFMSLGLFRALKSLRFDDMPKLRVWIRFGENNLPELELLMLENCPAMIDLPSLENSSSLTTLHIERCREMASLPKFPMSLQSVTIKESPKLKVHCQNGGREWLKLSRVRDVEIDGDHFQNPLVSSNPSTSSTSA